MTPHLPAGLIMAFASVGKGKIGSLLFKAVLVGDLRSNNRSDLWIEAAPKI